MKETPMKPNTLTDDQKMEVIEKSMTTIMQTLGLDLENESLKDTPKRIAKMYVKEIFSGLSEKTFPKVMAVPNEFEYDQMLISKGIEVKSVCEHHFVPVIGKCHIAYIPKDKVLGLSKFNRIVDYYSRRPQVQERLTEQVQEELMKILETEDVAVTIDAVHYCVYMRGVNQTTSITRTSSLGGVFKEDANARREYFDAIGEAK